MAYEISSSVGTSGITPQIVTSSHASANWEGGAINPAGTRIAIISQRHLGAGDSSTNYGFEILLSGSSGFAKNASIDTGAALPYWIKWKNDSTFYASLSTGDVYSYVSSSSGWAQGSEHIDLLTSDVVYHGYFNHDFTQLAATEIYNPAQASTMDDADRVYFFESGSGGWSSKSNYRGSGKVTSVTFINDDTAMIGQPSPFQTHNAYTVGEDGLIEVITHDGTSWSRLERVEGRQDSTYPYGEIGAGLYYHTASNVTIMSTINNSGHARFFVMPSGSQGYLPNNIAINDFTEIDVSHLTSSGRTYMRLSYGSSWNIDPASGDRIVVSSGDDLTTQRDERVFFAIESGSQGWKASKAINADTDGVGNARQGFQHSQISNGGATYVAYATGSYATGLSRVTIYPIIAADPSVSSVVSQEVPSDSVTTLKCGGTEASPDLTIAFQVGTLGAATTIACDSTIESDPRKNGITKTHPGALAASKVFSITPHGTNFNADKPATFTFSLTGDYAGTEPANLRLVKRLNDSSPWQEIPRNAWSNSGGTITLSVYSLSQFGAIIGGNTMARTKLNNYQLEKLLSGGTGTNAIGASAKALDIIGSGSGEEQISEISAVNAIADHYFVVQSSSGVTPQKIGVDVLQSYFSSLDITTAANDNEYSMVFVSGTGEQAIQVDASGFTYNPSADRLTVANLSASNDVDIAGTLDIDGAVAARSTLTVTGLISGSGGIDIAGAADFGAAVNVQGALDVDGATTLDGLTVAEAATFQSTLSATGLISGSGGIDIAGSADFGAAVNVQGALDVDGATTLDGLTVAEAAVLHSTLSVTGLISGSGGIDIAGSADFGAAVNVQGALDVDGATTLDGLTVAEAATFQSTLSATGLISGSGGIDIAGSADFGAAVNVQGLLSGSGGMDMAGQADFGGAVNVQGALDVDGATTLDGLTVAEAATFQSTLSATGLISGSGGIDIAGSADFGAAVNVQGALDVDGATTLDGLTVAEDAAFQQDVTITGDLTVNGDTTVISTTNLEVEDALILFSSGASGAPVNDQGFIFNRGNQDNAAMLWDESADRFVFANVASASADATGNISYSAYPVSASLFFGDGSNLLNVGATVRASSANANDDQQLLFTSGTGASQTLFIDSGSLRYNAASNTLKSVNLSGSGTLSVAGASALAGTLNVAGLISGSNGIDIAGAADFGAAVNVQGALDVDGATTLDGLTVAEAATFQSTLSATGLISGSGGIDIAGSADFGAAVNVQGALDVDGATTLDGLTVAEAATFQSTLSATGLISGSGGIDIAGSADFGAAVNVQGLLSGSGGMDMAGQADFGGAVNVQGALDVDGATTLDGLTVAEAAVLQSTLSVTGLISGSGGMDIAGQADFGGAVNVQGALDVDGATTLDGLTVAEAATLQSTLSVTGLISGSGGMDIAGNADFGAAVNVQGALDVDGATTLDGLTVAEAATLQGAVTLSGVSEVTANLVNDSFYILDSDDNQVHRDSIADVFELAKGDGIQVTSAGLISVSASQEIFQSSSLTAGLTASLAVNISSAMLANSLAVYLNGMLQLESGSIDGIFDYRTSGSNILMEAALDSDDILTVRYIKK